MSGSHSAFSDDNGDGGLAHLLNLIPEPTLAVNQHHRICFFNNRAEAAFGYTAADVLGQSLDMLLPDQARVDHEARLKDFAGSGWEKTQDGEWRPEMSGRHKSGEEFSFACTVNRLEVGGRHYFTAVMHGAGVLENSKTGVWQSEESYRELIETSLQGMVIQQDRRMVFVNQVFSDNIGYEVDELLGRDIDALIHPDDLSDILPKRAKMSKSGEYEIGEARAVCKDGSVAWFRTRVRAVTWQGRPARLITAISITERKSAEVEAERQRRYLATMERLAGVGSWGRWVDSEGSLWSDEIYRILGVPPGSIAAEFKAFMTFVHPDDRARVDELQATIIRTGEPLEEEIRIVRPNGDIRQAVTQWELLRDEDGRGRELAGSLQDVTERRVAEQALRDSEKRFRAIAENTPMALLIARQSDGVILFANNRVEAILGMPAGQLVGQNIIQFYWWPRDREIWFKHPDPDLQIGDRPMQMRAADGGRISTRHFLQSVSYDGEAATLSAFEDVTEREDLEERLRQAQKMEAVGQLTGGIAHDFNNLLSVIIGNLVHVLDDGTINEDVHELAVSSLAAAERGAGLTHRLLAFARQQPLAPEAVDLNDLINGMGDLLSRSLGPDITIRTSLEIDLHAVEIDAGQMENAILNLAINGRDAMTGGGELTLATSNLELTEILQIGEQAVLPGAYTVLSVSDTGAGMSEAVMKQALDPFFTTKRVGQGSGLGLSMVYGFIKQSGGHLRLESELERGTTISLLLPKASRVEAG
ncbi:MAG: PAS domain S-box protein [Rhodospirillaceae bacterium]|nr:PAS domain S-box protein [Rhodospirillaceae bacterium]MBT3492565.1 PAS domain S-box protein [Rhodospirillaceae bacterium]MBT3978983.1 PAS domain S-box protein [Rhodospirillaceae bacterium]MBT4743083.1 PAS domain S-box protein [Rhodospirillaceae bacterium]MBT6474684.1 PAS domain S-box protein [Rhodospirillaceae bacterium]